MRWNEPGLTVGSRVRAIRDCGCSGRYSEGELGTVEEVPTDRHEAVWVRFDNVDHWQHKSGSGLYGADSQNLEIFRGEAEMLFT